MLAKCKSDPSNCPYDQAGLNMIYQQKVASYNKYVELLSQGKCGDWSPPQAGSENRETGNENTTLVKEPDSGQKSGGSKENGGQEGPVTPQEGNAVKEEAKVIEEEGPVIPKEEKAAEEGPSLGDGEEIEEEGALIGFGILVGMSIAGALALKGIIKLVRGGKSEGKREAKSGWIEQPSEKSPIEQFTRSFEDSGKRLAGNLGELTKIGAGADAVQDVAEKLTKIYLSRSGELARKQMKIGGLGRTKPIIIDTPDPKVKIVKWDKAKTMLERMRIRINGKSIVRKYKLVDKLSKFAKGLGKGLSGLSKALQVYDSVSSYNAYVEKNARFIKKNPVLGRVLGATKAVGEQIINTVLTKNPLVGWADTVVSSLSGGKYSIMKGIQVAEGKIDEVSAKYYETVFRGEVAAQEIERMSKQHKMIKEHVRKLRDPKFVKKLKARGWTDDQIKRAMTRILGM